MRLQTAWCAATIPISLLWFALTSYMNIDRAAGLVETTFIGLGNVLIFI